MENNLLNLLPDVLTGFLTCTALIIAIGAQNAFVLRQGLRREHVLPIVAVCAGADAILIAAGIAGLGVLIETAPALVRITWIGGAIFLLCYGLAAGVRALRNSHLQAEQAPGISLGKALTTCLILTFLNPHVYLDTVVLMGALANQAGPDRRWLFGIGAILASITWFVTLGYGARFLTPLFRKASAWKWLDSCVAVMMLGLGVNLLMTNH